VARCARCGFEVRFLTADEAAVAVGVTTRAIYRWVEAGKLHFSETQSQTLICPNSLFAVFNRG
jgi:excisionase family DNA binding protein